MTNNPNYVLKFNESILVSKNERSSNFIKLSLLVIIGIIVLGSLVFGENLFKELSNSAKALLIALVITYCFRSNDRHREPSPIELRFYEEYLVIYREKHYYNKKLSRKEFNKFFYKDIHKCLYKKNLQKITIYGVVNGVWFDYNKDGTLPSNPSYNKTVDSMSYFYTIEEPNIDFVSEIENYSPLRVIVERN